MKRKRDEGAEGDKEPTVVEKKQKLITSTSSSSAATEPNKHDNKILRILRYPTDKLKTWAEFEQHFEQVAQQLLNEVVLVINGNQHRLAEIEFYLKCDKHHDPFTHSHSEVQKTCGNWYFHTTGSGYRGGSFKGMDISTGDGSKKMNGGILIRSIEEIGKTAKATATATAGSDDDEPEDKKGKGKGKKPKKKVAKAKEEKPKIYEGPSVSVDRILSLNNASSVADFVDNHLHKNLKVYRDSEEADVKDKDKGKGQEESKPLYLDFVGASKLEQREIYRSARVGLSLKGKRYLDPDQEKFLFKNYRFFTQPKHIKKGKHYMVLSLHHQGLEPSDITKTLGTKAATVSQYADLYNKGKEDAEGQEELDVSAFVGKDLSTAELCELCGLVSSHI